MLNFMQYFGVFLSRYGTGDPRRGSSDGRSPSSRWEKCLGIFETSDWLARQFLLFTHPTGATGEALVLIINSINV